MKSSVVLPESFLRCVAPADRKKLGKAGRTKSECDAVQAEKSERELQKQIVNLLRLKDIEVIASRTDRRTSNNVGTPDLIFAVHGQAHCWELKLPGGKLRAEQEQMALRLQSPLNGWRWRCIRSVDEALAELSEMGVGTQTRLDSKTMSTQAVTAPALL